MGFSVAGHMQQAATKITTPTIIFAAISPIRLYAFVRSRW
jgi:hypothetical protein